MGRTLKGTVFGGVKPRSYLPPLLDQCKSEVRLFTPFPITSAGRMTDVDESQPNFRPFSQLSRPAHPLAHFTLRLVEHLRLTGNPTGQASDSWDSAGRYTTGDRVAGEAGLRQGIDQDLKSQWIKSRTIPSRPSQQWRWSNAALGTWYTLLETVLSKMTIMNEIMGPPLWVLTHATLN